MTERSRGWRVSGRGPVGLKSGGCRGVGGYRRRQRLRALEHNMRLRKRNGTVPAVEVAADRMHGLLAEYLAWMETQNFSGDTVETRRVTIGYFLDWCRERGLDSTADITRPVLERYQRSLYQYR